MKLTMSRIILLTLKKHEDGIWIQKLLEKLERLISSVADRSVEVVVLEDYLSYIALTNDSLSFGMKDWALLVNRVSDAAEPFLFKACLSLLSAAKSRGIPVFNGPQSYSLCGNKWNHHVLFQQAGLSSPSTIAIFEPTADKMKEAARELSFPILIKPNAGGFGAGMIRVNNMEELPKNPPDYDDRTALLQEYESPSDGKLFRVWFLGDRVHCGIVRNDTSNQLSAGCVASVCSRSAPSFRLAACAIPDDVRNDIEKGLLPLLLDAHSGSVEFLYSEKSQRRLYFDLNLLSTLPLPDLTPFSDMFWNRDPWEELADTVLRMSKVLRPQQNVTSHTLQTQCSS